MRINLIFCTALLWFAVAAAGQEPKRAITAGDYFAMKNVSETRISPDGKWIAYTVTTADLKKDEFIEYLSLQ